jgi:hypothetical protein
VNHATSFRVDNNISIARATINAGAVVMMLYCRVMRCMPKVLRLGMLRD